jgi:hypothetical protein
MFRPNPHHSQDIVQDTLHLSFPYILFNMASSYQDSKAQAQVTPPDSPPQGIPSEENKIQLYANAIRGLFVDETQRPPDNGLEPITKNELIGLLEAALVSRESLSPSGIGHASLGQGGDNTTHGKYLPPCDVLIR